MPSLKIKTINNRYINFEYEPEDTVRMLKETVNSKEGFPVEGFSFIFNGQVLDVNKKLEEYNVKPGDTFIMIATLRGGAR